MQAVLIPFLLAANISQNNDATWEQGALSKWKGRINILVESNVQRLFSLSLTFDTQCMIKDETKLLCESSNFDSEIANVRSVKKNKFNVTVPIEITFNNHGIEQVTAPTVVYGSDDRVILMKKVTSLFHLGVDLDEKKDQLPRFSTTAQGVLGECSYNYSIHEELDDFVLPTDMPRQDRDYELFLISHPERKEGHLMTLQKHVDMMECDKDDQYLQVYMDTVDFPANSKSHSVTMKIGDRGYFRIIGYSEGHYEFEETKGVNRFDVTETFELALDNIEEATETLVEIDDPMTFSLALNDLGKPRPHDDSR